jgi:hypothetical protein
MIFLKVLVGDASSSVVSFRQSVALCRPADMLPRHSPDRAAELPAMRMRTRRSNGSAA